MALSLEALVELTGGIILEGNPDVRITGVASLLEARCDEASFLGNEKYAADFLKTSAGVVLVPPGLPQRPDGVALIEVANPSMAFNALVRHFQTSSYAFRPGIHPTAVIDPATHIDAQRVCVGPHAVIGANVRIGDGTDIGPGCVVGDSVQIGANCRLHARVVIRERCILRDRVTIQPGAVIGSDGFGFLLGEDGRYAAIDQVGIVELHDDTDIGANTTIDRARFGRTVIGEGTKIDNLVQIGHNVQVGKHTIIVSQSGIAGSTVVGDYCTIAAQVGITGHLTIGDKVTIAARSGVMNNLEANGVYWGAPAGPFKDASRQFAALRKLPEVLKEFNALKKTFLSDD